MVIKHGPTGSVLERARALHADPGDGSRVPMHELSAAEVDAATGADDLAGEDPKIALGRREFAVPEFTWRELKKLMPAMRRCTRIDFANLTEDDMNALGDLMWMVVVRDPQWDGGRDDFDNLPIRLPEILAAIPVITKQAGMEAAKAGEGEAAGSV